MDSSPGLDAVDLRILDALQTDATLSTQDVAERLGLAPTSCWRRIRALESRRVIRRRVALLDPEAVGLGVIAFVFVRTNRHEAAWLRRFADAIQAMPEIVETHRLSGERDYLLKVLVPDIKRFDAFYQRLIAAVPLYDVSTSFSLERIKETSALPLGYAGG
ncbi:MAG TPA: Lrp/AsnC family transcriptional regulator [Burkholderiaceae bacterium]|jgi:Lrp/AsnC family transcriptional regulator|nr:Lrp/AsnC family transcriptional regulator [Burkholderiaceae bacterium]